MKNRKKFEKYVKFCKKYIKLFGLQDYEFRFEQTKGRDGLEGAIEWSRKHKLATIFLSKTNTCKTDKELENVAYHEVLHCLLGDLDALAEERYINEIEIEAAVHAIIHRISEAYFK